MKIRRKVLNMPLEMWRKLDEIYPGEEFETTPQEFRDKIGLPCGLSAYFNDDEGKFFDQIHKVKR